jgi:hypothetical protein
MPIAVPRARLLIPQVNVLRNTKSNREPVRVFNYTPRVGFEPFWALFNTLILSCSKPNQEVLGEIKAFGWLWSISRTLVCPPRGQGDFERGILPRVWARLALGGDFCPNSGQEPSQFQNFCPESGQNDRILWISSSFGDR